MLKKIRNTILLLAVLLISFEVGFNLGKKDSNVIPLKSESIIDSGQATEKGLDFSLFWDVWDELYYHYLDKKSLDPKKMFYGAISGMVASLDDPYTVFLSPEQNKDAKEDLGGKFEGIGAQLGVKDKKIVVVAPLKNSPAEAAGLKPEDWIIKVDGKETINWTLPEAVTKIRGPKGSKVMLTVVHKNADKSVDIEVLRDEIKVPSVEWESLLEDCQKGRADSGPLCVKKNVCQSCLSVVYLKLTRFGDTTNTEWNQAVDRIVSEETKLPSERKLGLILDLRNNPGGYLAGAVYIASEFLKDGVVVTQENADGTKINYKVNRQGKLTDIPMVVLINKGSASASEIVAGALNIRLKVPLVGETSFGKGTVQEALDLSEGAGIHITTAKWLLPDGANINGDGLKPTVEIANSEEKPDEDLQLEKAVDTLYQSFNY